MTGLVLAPSAKPCSSLPFDVVAFADAAGACGLLAVARASPGMGAARHARTVQVSSALCLPFATAASLAACALRSGSVEGARVSDKIIRHFSQVRAAWHRTEGRRSGFLQKVGERD